MPTPSIFPVFLKAKAGDTFVAGVTYVEQFSVEVLEMIEVEIVDETITVEIVDVIDVAVIDETIEVEIPQ
jgi:hypothetical protein